VKLKETQEEKPKSIISSS